MDHAEAQRLLADLALELGRLARLEQDASPDAGALRAHMSACTRCAADLESWRRTWRAIAVAATDGDKTRSSGGGLGAALDGDPGLLRAPASLRAGTMAAVAAEHVATRSEPVPLRSGAAPGPSARSAGRGRRWMPWLAVAAALVIAVGAGSLAWSRTVELDHARTENAGLTATTATLDRVLAAPVHWVTTLRSPDGSAGGTVAWTATELAVITTTLPGPPADHQAYRCWVERDGVRTPVGAMSFSGSTGYWAGSMEGWSSAFAPGATFGVSLVSDGGGAAPVLVGQL